MLVVTAGVFQVLANTVFDEEIEIDVPLNTIY
jgi:hypothetical protein